MTCGRETQLYHSNITRPYPNMQDSTIDPLDLNKRQVQSGQYDVPPPPDSGTWDQLHKQTSKGYTRFKANDKNKD